MGDLVMCTSYECPMRKSCRRHSGISASNSQYYNFEYSCNENSGFADYMTLKINKNTNITKSLL